MTQRPLVVHLTYALDVGGLETLIVDSINRMPAHRYRHAVICITRYTDFAKRITQPGVELYALDKQPGPGLGSHRVLWSLLKRLRPAILHTYNLSAAEYAFTAAMAGVPVRIHAEHGRDASDPQGLNRKYNLLRRLLTPFIDRYVPVSGDLERWLRDVVGIPAAKIQLIDNGVDTERFIPVAPGAPAPDLWGFGPGCFVIGSVGRIQDVKDHASLLDAFIAARASDAALAARLRLVLVGDGPLLAGLRDKASRAGLGESVVFAGARSDIAHVMQSFALFALSSIAEGMPVTLLEAMASALPVVSTRVGGIPELIRDGANGTLVPPSDPGALASAILAYARAPDLCAAHGAAARATIEQRYSLHAMLAAYTELYDNMCKKKLKLKETITPCAE